LCLINGISGGSRNFEKKWPIPEIAKHFNLAFWVSNLGFYQQYKVFGEREGTSPTLKDSS
jgi:hypothetical protein